MSEREDRLNDCHNKGQEDYAEGKYEPMYDSFGELFQDDRSREENDAYHDGRDNAREQDK